MPTTAPVPPATAPPDPTHQFIKAVVNPAAPTDRTKDYICQWCQCSSQIGVKAVAKPTFLQETCGSFTSADCEKSLWAEWSTCSYESGTCGIGTKTRMKKCSITLTGGTTKITQVTHNLYDIIIRYSPCTWITDILELVFGNRIILGIFRNRSLQ